MPPELHTDTQKPPAAYYLDLGLVLAVHKALNTFLEDNNSIKGTSRQEKAGIVFPPSIIEKFLRNFGYLKIMVTSNAPIYLAGVIEYLSSEILENASLHRSILLQSKIEIERNKNWIIV